MTRNDKLFKFLFALELALVPLVMLIDFVDSMPGWSRSLYVAGIFVCFVWMQILKSKSSFSHKLINSIGEIGIILSLLIYFCAIGYVNLALTIIVGIVVVLVNLLKLALHNKFIPELIQTISVCNCLFVVFILIGLILIYFNNLILLISLIAFSVSGAILILYKLFFILKYTDIIYKIKNAFRKK